MSREKGKGGGWKDRGGEGVARTDDWRYEAAALLIINRAAGIRLIATPNLLFRSIHRSISSSNITRVELIRCCLVAQEFPEASPPHRGYVSAALSQRLSFAR